MINACGHRTACHSRLQLGKLREFVRGELMPKENEDLYPHVGVVRPGSSTSELLSFMGSVYDPDRGDLPTQFGDTHAARVLRRRAATEYVGERFPDLSSFVVDLTERDVEISQAQALATIAHSVIREGAPCSVLIFGGMNRGKTGFAGLWLELWRVLVPLNYRTEESVVVTNMRTLDPAEHVIMDIGRFREFIFVDEQYLDSGGVDGESPEIPPKPLYGGRGGPTNL